MAGTLRWPSWGFVIGRAWVCTRRARLQVNDVDMTNGVCHEAAPAAVGPRAMIDRTEYVRLLEQALHSLGFLAAAQALERESVCARSPLRICRWR